MTEQNDHPGLGSPKKAGELLDMYYLPMRSALMEAAAGLDRIQRAGQGRLPDDPRVAGLREACRVIAGPDEGRAERFQHLLSAPLDGGAVGDAS
jgi:hypothetical protein